MKNKKNIKKKNWINGKKRFKINKNERRKNNNKWKKRKLKDDLQGRKIVLRNKVNHNLESGNYKTKNDIYEKVFSEEELNEIKKMSNDDENYNKKRRKKDEDFFLTR